MKPHKDLTAICKSQRGHQHRMPSLFVLAGGFSALCLCTSALFAAEPVQARPEVTPQALPVPEVNIRANTKRDDVELKEWRVNGKVMALRVEPKNGMPAYYLTDPDGDGIYNVDSKFNPDEYVAQWTLFTF